MLPTIRRHGVYAYDDLLADDEFLEHAIATLRAEQSLVGGGTESLVLRPRVAVRFTPDDDRDCEGLRTLREEAQPDPT
ncbi:putative DNA-binding bacteriophage protein [Corynebacterium diphtheriae BH8]|uniref:hypothetical protein n=1 Tax=Corynebacterium diphtheriae TaxID=1717 RepID=UPI000245ADA7|nr:hypothetical protein [Corynebacterium diphtheriae]AEX49643.1 putative DNA-binding bacteriophage protein [Corynebacterium diphtheriae BH8]CAB0526108.1 hypothetical protein CIP100629_02151 [Corynebacterium diphtheriae]CAB0666192.1 hypothetical protein CIP107575_02126 [Corynebacterium diphtheriae]CAB0872007.1 hypothetical protein FRC0370_01972 [Corynebacterium diphtheriae]CAB0968947.1 hypothetical protein FRC0463_01970 [Corynebacterium diphtheriae]